MEFQLHYTEQDKGLPLYCYTETGESSDYFLIKTNIFPRNIVIAVIQGRKISKGRRSFLHWAQFVEDLKQLLGLLGIEKDYFAGF